jgi:hypothetical protein
LCALGLSLGDKAELDDGDVVDAYARPVTGGCPHCR